MNTTNTTTDTTANATAATKAKKPRSPRAKKAAATTAPELLPAPELTKATTAPATHTATTAAQIAAAFFILVTLPPVEKFEAGKGYWQIEIRDSDDRRCSNVYRIKDLAKARELAEKMARDRGYPIVTKEPPAPSKAHPAAEEAPAGFPEPEAGQDYSDADEPTPF
jgi:hypothetical protein